MYSLLEQTLLSVALALYTLLHYAYITNLTYISSYITRFIQIFVISYLFVYGMQFGFGISNTVLLGIIVAYMLLPYLIMLFIKMINALYLIDMRTIKGRFQFVFAILGLCMFLTILQLLPHSS